MSGIKEAYEKKSLDMDKGIIKAMGKFDDTNFMLVELEGEIVKGEIITEYDYGSDVRFQAGIKVGDCVELIIVDEYSAEWRKVKDVEDRNSKESEKKEPQS